jgi:hypothetical protein
MTDLPDAHVDPAKLCLPSFLYVQYLRRTGPHSRTHTYIYHTEIHSCAIQGRASTYLCIVDTKANVRAIGRLFYDGSQALSADCDEGTRDFLAECF